MSTQVIDTPAIRYDRTVHEDFLAIFAVGGVASSLVEYVRHGGAYALDLQFRKNPKSNAQHASLYVGLTSVLDVHRDAKGQFCLRANPTWACDKNHWSEAWREPMSLETLGTKWNRIENYLETVIPIASKGYATREGAVQAAVSSFASSAYVMLDREVVVGFANAPLKARIKEELARPLLEVLQSCSPDFGKAPTGLGDECDLLALTAAGQLLAVEVKPQGASTIAWAAAQATMYSRLLTRWLEVDPGAIDSLAHMLDQRRRVGLVHSDIAVPPNLRVIPAVALQRGTSPTHVARLFSVQDALLDAGVGDSDLVVYQVNLTGKLVELGNPARSAA